MSLAIKKGSTAKETKPGIISMIIPPVIVALLVGSTTPWWFMHVFPSPSTAPYCKPIYLDALTYDTKLSSSYVGRRPEPEQKGLIGSLRPSGAGADTVVFTFPGSGSEDCQYLMSVGYATERRRPIRITLNNTSVEQALSETTGGYASMKVAGAGGKWKLQAQNRLTLASYDPDPIPHLSFIALEPAP